MSFFQIMLSLFLVLNSIGSIPLFISVLKSYSPRRQRRIIAREMLIALFIVLIFTFFGEGILHLIGVTRAMVGIAGGVLLFIISLGMIFPKNNHHPAPSISQEPMIVPLAMPGIAGPGTIATVMVYSERVSNPWLMCAIILAAWIPSALILFSAVSIKKVLGEKGMIACERLGGMLVCLIAIKLFFTGLIEMFQPPL